MTELQGNTREARFRKTFRMWCTKNILLEGKTESGKKIHENLKEKMKDNKKEVEGKKAKVDEHKMTELHKCDMGKKAFTRRYATLQ